MEFSCGKDVPAPYWLFIKELSSHFNRHDQVLHVLKLTSQLWTDRLVNGTYKGLVRNIKKDLLQETACYYDLGVTLDQLKGDSVISILLDEIKEFISSHFTD